MTENPRPNLFSFVFSKMEIFLEKFSSEKELENLFYSSFFLHITDSDIYMYGHRDQSEFDPRLCDFIVTNQVLLK